LGNECEHFTELQSKQWVPAFVNYSLALCVEDNKRKPFVLSPFHACFLQIRYDFLCFCV